MIWILAVYHSKACLFPVHAYSYRIALQDQTETFIRICTIGESQILSFVSLYLWGPQKHSSVSQVSLMHRQVTLGQKLPSTFSFYLSKSSTSGLVILMYFGKGFNLSLKMFNCFQWQVWSELPNPTYWSELPNPAHHPTQACLLISI